MKLSEHDLLKLTDEKLEEWPKAVLRVLSVKLLNDLKETQERLRRTSRFWLVGADRPTNLPLIP